MVNGLHLHSAFIQSAVQFMPLIHPFTHTFTYQWQLAAMQGTNQLVRSNWGLGVLLTDTSTRQRLGSNPPTTRRELLPPEPYRPRCVSKTTHFTSDLLRESQLPEKDLKPLGPRSQSLSPIPNLTDTPPSQKSIIWTLLVRITELYNQGLLIGNDRDLNTQNLSDIQSRVPQRLRMLLTMRFQLHLTSATIRASKTNFNDHFWGAFKFNEQGKRLRTFANISERSEKVVCGEQKCNCDPFFQ